MVIDVLRATTTISWALKNGADSIQVFADLDLLKESAIKWQAEKRLMLGERGGKKIEGFDSDHGDWFWASYDSNGDINKAGSISSCYNCHASGTDYIRFTDH